MPIKALLVTISLILPVCIFGCKKNSSEQSTKKSSEQSEAGFILDYNNADQPQVLKSELFLRYISITQYHIGQDQPTTYYANDISKIVLHNTMSPGTDWFLDQIDIHMKDRTVKTEHCVKVWHVYFDISFGNGSQPVLVEQHFTQHQDF